MKLLFLKGIELWIRRQFNRHVGARSIPLIVSGATNAIPINDAARFLVLRQDRIGDVLISVPVIRALRKLFPLAVIDVVLSQNNIAVRNALSPFINDVVLYTKGLAGMISLRHTLRKRRYDVVIDCMDNASATSAMLISATQARYRVGIDKENRGIYSHVVPLADRSSTHIVDRIARLLWPFGVDIPIEERKLAFELTDSEASEARRMVRIDDTKKRFIGLNISGSDLGRMYPEEGIIRVARQARSMRSDTELVLLSAPKHLDILRRISVATNCRMIQPVASFSVWAAIIAQLDGLITADSSVVHLAAAFSIPSVVLFVHNQAELMPWYPYATQCYACETTTERLADIPVETVVTAVRRLIIGE